MPRRAAVHCGPAPSAGLQKLMHFSKFAASVASKGLPFPKLWAMLDVAIEVLGPIALIIGLWPRWGPAASLDGDSPATGRSYPSFRSPVIDLNRAVAVGMSEDEVARTIVDRLVHEPALKGYHLLPIVRRDLCSQKSETAPRERRRNR